MYLMRTNITKEQGDSAGFSGSKPRATLCGMRTSLIVTVVLGACGNATPPAQAPSAPPSAVPAAAAAPAAATPAAAAAQSAVGSLAMDISEADAERAAETWLAKVDAGKYAESWTEAAAPFRAAIDQPGWLDALTRVRAPLGALKSRALKSAHYAKSLPGVPDGEYVVVQFDAAFDEKQQAVETVTPMKEADGQWRVSGYFIK
jgi:Protein of unknown function (DUF4019)